jgi:multiple sugar transport system permease protein
MAAAGVKKTASYLILTLGVVLVAFPFFWMLSTSLKTTDEVNAVPPKLLPASPQFGNYAHAWKSAGKSASDRVSFTAYFRNSLIVAAAVTLGVLFTSILAGYAFAFIDFWGKKLIFLLFLSTMMIPFEVAMIPNYITIHHLGLYDTLAALIVPWIANVFSIFILRQYFMTIPRDYFEAAQIDGCSHWRFMWQVATPMAAPALATITIFTFLGSWNAFLWPLLATSSPRMRVVQVGLSFLRGEESTNLNTLMAASAIVIIPVVVLYLLLQRRFIEGVAGTGLKG